MKPTKELPKNIINPFSQQFLDKWLIWKQYKLEEFGFKYKGVISEQAALMNLATISGGLEDIAEKIIDQSLSNRWRGLFILKETINGKQPASNEQFRKDITDILGSRNY